MSKGFKGMMTAIIALVAAVAFLIGFVATGANNGSKTVAETVAAGGTQTEGNEGTGKETIRDSAGKRRRSKRKKRCFRWDLKKNVS